MILNFVPPPLGGGVGGISGGGGVGGTTTGVGGFSGVAGTTAFVSPKYYWEVREWI